MWAVTDDAQLSRRARDLLRDRRITAFVSSVSIQEIAVKRARHGVARMPLTARQAIAEFDASGFRPAPVTWLHAAAVEGSPNLHLDPFDRLLIAQSLAEPYRLVTHDRRLAAYSDTVILV